MSISDVNTFCDDKDSRNPIMRCAVLCDTNCIITFTNLCDTNCIITFKNFYDIPTWQRNLIRRLRSWQVKMARCIMMNKIRM